MWWKDDSQESITKPSPIFKIQSSETESSIRNVSQN
uniref:Bm1504 n=1 Tax=Brugia malayi TaxID=6279 RepID=A0A1I9G4Z0_BRUMA|nr:Bm1504 [Brugia malayi]